MKYYLTSFLLFNLTLSQASSLFIKYEELPSSMITEVLDTLYIDLAKDLDFRFKKDLVWYQDNELGLFGIKNKKSNELYIEPMFSEIESFSDGVSIVTFNDLQGAINDLGEIIIPFKFSELQTSSEERIAYYKDHLWGFLDTQGKEIIPATYDYVSSFSEGLVLASKNNLFGYLDVNGKVIIPFQYDYASNFENGYAQVEMRFTTFTIDKKGRKIEE